MKVFILTLFLTGCATTLPINDKPRSKIEQAAAACEGRLTEYQDRGFSFKCEKSIVKDAL